MINDIRIQFDVHLFVSFLRLYTHTQTPTDDDYIFFLIIWSWFVDDSAGYINVFCYLYLTYNT